MKPRKISASLLLFFFASVLCIIIFFPFSFRIFTDVPNVIDPLFYAWNLDHNADVIINGASLTDTNIYYPMTNTLAFSDTLWAQSILATPVIIATGNPVLATNLSVLITFPLAALGMYLLAYYLTSHKIAAIGAGILYAFSYPRLAQLGHVPAVASQWLPLVFLYVIRFLRQPSVRTLALSYLFAVLSFASSIYFGIFLAIGVPIIAFPILFMKLKSREKGYLSNIFRTSALLFLPILVMTLFLVYPYLRLKAEHPEYKRSLYDISGLRAQPSDYLNVLPTSLIAQLGMPTGDPEHALFPTITLLVLGFLGLRSLERKDRLTGWIFAALAIISFILSLGDETLILGRTVRLPYYYLFSYISLFQTIRVPARLSIFVILGLAVLASYGIRKLIPRSKLVLWGLAFLFFIEIIQTGTPSVRVPDKSQIPPVYAWLNSQKPDTVIAEIPVRRFWNGLPMKEQLMVPYEDITPLHNYAAETYRVYFSSFHGRRMINGYGGFFPVPYTSITEQLETFPVNEAAWNELKLRKVDLIIVHTDQYGDDAGGIMEALSARQDIREAVRFGDAIVYEIISEANVE